MRFFLLAIVTCTMLSAADQKAPTTAPARVIGDPRLRLGDDVSRLRLSLDGTQLVSCSGDRTIRWWDVKTYKEVKRWASEKANGLWDFELLPNDRMLVASRDKLVMLVDLKTGKELKTFKHTGAVYRLRVAKDGKRFLACGSFKETILWNLETGKKIRSFPVQKGSVYSPSFSHDESLIYTCGSDEIMREYSVETGKETWQKAPGAGDLFVLERHPTKKLMAVCSDDRSMWIEDLMTRESMWNADIGKEVQCVAWSPDGSRIAAVGDVMAVMETGTGKKIMETKVPEGYNWAVCWSRDGKKLYASSANVIMEFDPATGKRIFPAPEVSIVTGGVRQAQCVDTKGVIFFSNDSKGIQRVDGTTGKPLPPLFKDKYLQCMALSPDGKRLVCGGSDGVIRALNTKDGKEVEVWTKRENDDTIQAIAFDRDGTHVFVGSADGNAYMLRMKDGNRTRKYSRADAEKAGKKPAAKNKGFEDIDLPKDDFDWGGELQDSPDVEHLSVSTDGLLLAAVYDDNTVILWRVVNGNMAETIKGDPGKPEIQKSLFLQSNQVRLLVFGRDSDKPPMLAIWEAPLPPAMALGDKEIAKLIDALGSDSFRGRRKATKALIALGSGVLPHLRKVKSDDPEIAFRINKVMEGIGLANVLKRLPLTFDPTRVLDVEPSIDAKSWLAVCATRGTRSIETMTLKENAVVILSRYAGNALHRAVQSTAAGELVVGNENGTFSIFKTK